MRLRVIIPCLALRSLCAVRVSQPATLHRIFRFFVVIDIVSLTSSSGRSGHYNSHTSRISHGPTYVSNVSALLIISIKSRMANSSSTMQELGVSWVRIFPNMLFNPGGGGGGPGGGGGGGAGRARGRRAEGAD